MRVARPGNQDGSLPLLHALRNLHPTYPAKEWADLLLADWESRSHGANPDPHEIAVIGNQAALLYFRLGDLSAAESLCRRLIDRLRTHSETFTNDRALHLAFQPLINLARIYNASGRQEFARAVSDFLVGLMVNGASDGECVVDGVGARMRVRRNMQADPDFVRFIWANGLIEGFKARRRESVTTADAFLRRMGQVCPSEFGSLIDEGRCIAYMETGCWDEALCLVRAERAGVDIQLIFLLQEAVLLKRLADHDAHQELLCKIAAAVVRGILQRPHPAFELAILDLLLRMWGPANANLRRALVDYGRRQAREALDQRYWRIFDHAACELGLNEDSSHMGRYADYYHRAPEAPQYPDGLVKLYEAVMSDD